MNWLPPVAHSRNVVASVERLRRERGHGDRCVEWKVFGENVFYGGRKDHLIPV